MTTIPQTGKSAARSSAAERMRRHRQRRRIGLFCINIEICSQEVEALIDRGLLAPDSRDDLDDIRLAIYQLFELTLPT